MRYGLKRLMSVMAAGVLLALGASSAKAGLLPISASINPEGANFRWTYAIVLPTDMKLQSGNYFTIYDFAGYVSGAEQAPENWVFSAQKVGPTPELLKPTDDDQLYNLTWKYVGETIPTGQIGLGNFWAISTFSDQKSSSFTATTNRTSDGARDNNITETITPTGTDTPPPPGVPEPGTLLLAALGLPIVGAARWYQKRK